ncbi:MAG: hypothetical protein JWS12_74 [Candidatus Saccharibacteria bacterium]|nr:hypothetical protein [Candidatus Saccharibacteria bacterium]
MSRSKNLFEKAVTISEDYLGPAAERFMARQISTHLGKPPDLLTKKDLSHLINWIKPTFALLTDNTELVDTFVDRLQSLSDNRTQSEDH